MGFFDNLPGKQNLNIEIGDKLRINDVCEKLGSIFGEEGRRIGKELDDITKDKTIRIDLKNDKKDSY